MTPPSDADALAFAVLLIAAVVTGSVLRVRRDVTGPELSRTVNFIWTVSLVGIGVGLLAMWLFDLPDGWIFWPVAVVQVGCMCFVLGDTVSAMKRSHRSK